MSTRPRPASASPRRPTAVADDLHQRAGRELRKMTQERQQAIVGGGADDSRLGPERAHEGQQLVERLTGPSSDGVNSHGRPLKRSGRACSSPLAAAPPSGWPPTNVNRGGRSPRRFDNRALGAAGVGHDRWLPHVSRRARSRSARFCRTGAARITTSASASTMRSSAATSIACRRIAVSSTSLLSTPMTSELGQISPRGQRDRPADQPEADDADPGEYRLPPCRGRRPPGWMTGIST